MAFRMMGVTKEDTRQPSSSAFDADDAEEAQLRMGGPGRPHEVQAPPSD